MWAAVFTADSEWKKRSLVIPVSQTDVLRAPEKYRGTNEKHQKNTSVTNSHLSSPFPMIFYFFYICPLHKATLNIQNQNSKVERLISTAPSVCKWYCRGWPTLKENGTNGRSPLPLCLKPVLQMIVAIAVGSSCFVASFGFLEIITKRKARSSSFSVFPH